MNTTISPDKRQENLQIKLTTDEKHRMKRTATALGLSLSAWVRSVLLRDMASGTDNIQNSA